MISNYTFVIHKSRFTNHNETHRCMSEPYFSLSHQNQNVYNVVMYIYVGMPLGIGKCQNRLKSNSKYKKGWIKMGESHMSVVLLHA